MSQDSGNTINITRWRGSLHPTMTAITNLMKEEQLRPYMWMNTANHRYAVRSHKYHKVLYVVDGTVEVLLPDVNQRVKLNAGDRIDLPAGVRYGTIIGASGAKCVEAGKKTSRKHNTAQR